MTKERSLNNYSRQFGLIIAFIIIIVSLTILSNRFLTLPNIINILRQATINGIIAVGMTLVILTAGIDLSVGSVLGLTAVITADLLHSNVPVFIAVLSGLLLGFIIGLLNGFLITRIKIPPFIATLGMMNLARGLAFTYTQGKPITGLNEHFRFLGTGMVGSIPFPIILAGIVFGAGYLLMRKSRHGEYIYALGNNETAARFSGIPVKKYITVIYGISGLLSALAGLILVGRLDSAQPIIGQGYEFDAIAAVVVGGTSFTGGEGSIWGTLIGVLIIAVINNGLNLLDVSSFYEQVVKGVVIAGALLLHHFAHKKIK